MRACETGLDLAASSERVSDTQRVFSFWKIIDPLYHILNIATIVSADEKRVFTAVVAITNFWRISVDNHPSSAFATGPPYS